MLSEKCKAKFKGNCENVSASEKVVGSAAAAAQLHINRCVCVCVFMKLFSEL